MILSQALQSALPPGEALFSVRREAMWLYHRLMRWGKEGR
jgi:hypothetical protein